MSIEKIEALIIGTGPAGLMAASQLAAAGKKVLVVDAKPSVGRKFLMAGKSGLNLTKDEPLDVFLSAYGAAQKWLSPMLEAFGPQQVQAWATDLGQQVFTGSSGKVFPKTMKTSPLLRAWLAELTDQGVEFRTRWRWTGIEDQRLMFDTPDGPKVLAPTVTILALGGASWARLGSDGAWADIINVPTAPFRPSNMGFLREWSKFMEPHFGAPIKPVGLSFAGHAIKGEFVITSRGVEGSAIYAMSAALRDGMDKDGVTLTLDLIPDRSLEDVIASLSKPRGKNSLTNHMRKTLGLKGAKAALLREMGGLPTDTEGLARRIKALPLHLDAPTPLDEAISTAGGVLQTAVSDTLMLTKYPGVFCAGEMLDWEAPTGGYLLTACLATGRIAGLGAVEYIEANT